jgi:glycosyltransferase involved in cell wall biosynthesis
MRVAWVIDGPLDQLSGGYLYDRLVVDHLRREAVDVTLLSLPTGSYGARLARGWRSDFAKMVTDASPDILVQDELSHPALLRVNRRLASSRPGLKRVGLIHHLRASEPRSFLANLVYRWIERRYLASLDAFIFNSRTTHAAVQRLGLPASASIVAVPGADRLAVSLGPEAIHSRAQEAGPLRVLFLGNLIPRKGLLTLVEAVALLPRGSVDLTVVGSPEVDPRHAQRVRRRVSTLRLGPIVHFLGALEGQALARMMLAAQVLAVPSAYEGYGMAYLEGMGYGLPPIAGAEGGASEFVRQGENGFLVEAGDAAALAVLLASLGTDRLRLRRMALAARQTYLAHPTWEESGAAIRTFLFELARARSAPASSADGPQAGLGHPGAVLSSTKRQREP